MAWCGGEGEEVGGELLGAQLGGEEGGRLPALVGLHGGVGGRVGEGDGGVFRRGGRGVEFLRGGFFVEGRGLAEEAARESGEEVFTEAVRGAKRRVRKRVMAC